MNAELWESGLVGFPGAVGARTKCCWHWDWQPQAGPGAIGRVWGGWSELVGLFGALRILTVHNFEEIPKQNAI